MDGGSKFMRQDKPYTKNITAMADWSLKTANARDVIFYFFLLSYHSQKL